MTAITYSIPSIHCAKCTRTIETELQELQGIQSAKADPATKLVEVTFDAPADEEKIKSLLAEIEYPVKGLIQL